MVKKAGASQQALLKFFYDQYGGEQAAMREFYKVRIADLAVEDGTAGDLFNEARDDGWIDHLFTLPLTELGNVINPTSRASGRSGKRLTAAEKQALYKRVITFLQSNPWSTNPQIAAEVGVEGRKLGVHLRTMKEEELLKSVGARRDMKYATKAEKTTPKQ